MLVLDQIILRQPYLAKDILKINNKITSCNKIRRMCLRNKSIHDWMKFVISPPTFSPVLLLLGTPLSSEPKEKGGGKRVRLCVCVCVCVYV